MNVNSSLFYFIWYYKYLLDGKKFLNAYVLLPSAFILMRIISLWISIFFFIKMLDNQESADVDTQEHSFTRTIDEEAEMEEQAERDREEGHIEQEDEEEEREHEVMTAGSKYLCGSTV